MLEELRIQNFAIIEEVALDFHGGFNVITGETGAGKSILIDAVELLLGNRADSSMVRAGEDKAIIEGTFALDDRTRFVVAAILIREEIIDDESEAGYVTLSRELRSSGRSSSRINGTSCKVDLLREVGSALVDIHGQSGHLSLLQARTHIDLLDRYANLLEIREALAQVVDSLADIRREMERLQSDKDELQRRADRLRYEVDEIEEADLDPEEENELLAERSVLSNSEKLAELALEAVALLSGEDDEEATPIVDGLMQIANLLERLVEIDEKLSDEHQLAEELSTNAQELAITLSSYADEVEHDPNRLNELEERLEMIRKLKRRYDADSIQDILDYADRARDELASIEHSDERIEELRAEEEKTLRHIGDLCERISKVREVAGRALSKRLIRELKDLRMEKTRFEVVRQRQEDPNGAFGKDGVRYQFDRTGFEDVEFMMSANPGEPLRPLAKVASGGEAARIMLALKRVLTYADKTPTLIFDEIDQGIGGRIGAVVGEKLWSLSDGHQVLVVTHLPQLASYGDLHFHVSKSVKNKRTRTVVTRLAEEEQRTDEIAAMLGAIGESGQQSARDILHEAHTRKQQLRPAPVSEPALEQKNLL